MSLGCLNSFFALRKVKAFLTLWSGNETWRKTEKKTKWAIFRLQ